MNTISNRQKRSIGKDSRAYRLSHEAYLYIKALAEQQGVSPGAFLEITSRQLAQERLSVEQRSSIVQKAQQITAERRNVAG